MTSSKPLNGTRIVSLALNLPGPAAFMRMAQLGAQCTKVEPPAPAGLNTSDPMGQYNRAAYAQLHAGMTTVAIDLKTPTGLEQLNTLLASTDVLLSSFRPSAMTKLGLTWERLHADFPRLIWVAIVGERGAGADTPGHDLTYMAQAGLVPSLAMPPTLFADMGGALMASEAVLAALLARSNTGQGSQTEVALCDAADWLALPHRWGMTAPQGAVGGAHAGYKIYPAQNARVCLAALEPHFAARLCQVVGIPMTGLNTLFEPATHAAVAAFFANKDPATIEALALAHDLPLHVVTDVQM